MIDFYKKEKQNQSGFFSIYHPKKNNCCKVIVELLKIGFNNLKTSSLQTYDFLESPDRLLESDYFNLWYNIQQKFFVVSIILGYSIGLIVWAILGLAYACALIARIPLPPLSSITTLKIIADTIYKYIIRQYILTPLAKTWTPVHLDNFFAFAKSEVKDLVISIDHPTKN